MILLVNSVAQQEQSCGVIWMFSSSWHGLFTFFYGGDIPEYLQSGLMGWIPISCYTALCVLQEQKVSSSKGKLVHVIQPCWGVWSNALWVGMIRNLSSAAHSWFEQNCCGRCTPQPLDQKQWTQGMFSYDLWKSQCWGQRFFFFFFPYPYTQEKWQIARTT